MIILIIVIIQIFREIWRAGPNEEGLALSGEHLSQVVAPDNEASQPTNAYFTLL